MLLSGPFKKFVEASPVSVMMRGIIENLFHPERLDRLFRRDGGDSIYAEPAVCHSGVGRIEERSDAAPAMGSR